MQTSLTSPEGAPRLDVSCDRSTALITGDLKTHQTNKKCTIRDFLANTENRKADSSARVSVTNRSAYSS